jgi:hypothetical protein
MDPLPSKCGGRERKEEKREEEKTNRNILD